MSRHRILSDQRGASAAELALILPLLLLLLFGGLEAGHFIWTQHKLTEAVRDGARYASRLDAQTFCPSLNTVARDRIMLLTRTGQLENAAAKSLVPGWEKEKVVVTPFCDKFVDTGIYADLANGEKGPIVIVEARNVNYPSLFFHTGVIVPLTNGPLSRNAKASAAVIGL